MSREGYLPHGLGHEDTGEGCTLFCPRVFGVACESCTCDAPCTDAYDKTVEVEWVRRNADKNTCRVCGSKNWEVRNRSAMWGDGDVCCSNGHYMRPWDSG